MGRYLVFLFMILAAPLAAQNTTALNGGFEDSTELTAWSALVWEKTAGVTEVRIDNQAYSGSRSLLIDSKKPNDARVIQPITVIPGKYYRVSARVMTRGVGMEAKGASLSLEGRMESSADLKGNQGWVLVEWFFYPPQNVSSVNLCLGLGGYGSLNSGQAWFDEVTVDVLDRVPFGKSFDNMGGATENSSPAASGRSKNLARNSGFEKAWGKNKASKWYTSAYLFDENSARFIYNTTESRSGRACVTIENPEMNDSRFYQNIAVKPASFYRVSGYIRVDRLEGGQGGTICLMDGYASTREVRQTGGNWEYVEFYGRTGPYQRVIPVGLRLGGLGSSSVGRASFDDVSVTEVLDVPEGVEILNMANDGSNPQEYRRQLALKKAHAERNANPYLIFEAVLILIVAACLLLAWQLWLRYRFEALAALVSLYRPLLGYLLLIVVILLTGLIYFGAPWRVSNLGVQAVFGLTAAVALLYLAWRWRQKKLTPGDVAGVVIVLGIALRIAYFFYTEVWVRQHDVQGAWGHLDYILYVAQHFSLPPTGNWQTYHPPLHYIGAAVFYDLARLAGVAADPAVKAIQLYGVLMASLTLYAARGLLQRAGLKGWGLVLAVALVSFHPTGIYFSSAYNNDVTMLFLTVLALERLVAWYQQQTVRNILLLALVSALAILAKFSAVGLIPVIGLVFLAALWQNRSSWMTYVKPFALFLAVFVPLALSYTVRNTVSFEQGLGFFAPAFGNPLPAGFHQLTGLHPQELVTEPFVDLNRAEHFPDYLVRSSLFGEWRFDDQIDTARAMMALGVFLCLGIALFLLLRKPKEWLEGYDALFLLVAVVFILLHLQFRLMYPKACTQDFRYISPILVSLGWFAVRAEAWMRERLPGLLKYAYLAAAMLFCALSVLFILGIGVTLIV